jgi:Na+/melibiose symporter-like transporter
MFQDSGMNPTDAFRTVLWIIAGVSLVCMLLPVLFIDEKRYCVSIPTEDRVWQSLGKVVKNKNFMKFTFSDFAYWISLTFITSGMVYFVTVLLNLPKEFYSQLMLVMFLLSFVFYVPVNFIAKKVGKRRLLVIAFGLFIVTYAFSIFLGLWPFGAEIQGYIVVVLAAVALAIFGILPNALVSDIAEAWAVETGEHKAGIYFGFRTFMQKMGASVAALVLPSLIKIGAPENTLTGVLGVRLAAVFALVFCVVGLVLLLLYDEKKVNATLAKIVRK